MTTKGANDDEIIFAHNTSRPSSAELTGDVMRLTMDATKRDYYNTTSTFEAETPSKRLENTTIGCAAYLILYYFGRVSRIR